MQYRCVDINKKKLKLWEKCHFVQQNLHMDWHEIELRTRT
jgi:hypothetical protein